EATEAEAGPKTFTAYSKFDFLPGNEIIAYDDFSTTETGDFPLQWNTNTGAEIVEFDEVEGHWLKLNNLKGNFIPEYIKELPENFTLEFDFIADFQPEYAYQRLLRILLTEVQDPAASLSKGYTGKYGFFMDLSGGVSRNTGELKWSQVKDGYLGDVRGQKGAPQHLNGGLGSKVTRVSIWRQKTRVRMYLDEQKVIDLPRAIATDAQLNQIRFFSAMTNEKENIYFSNVRFAVGKPDARHALVETGRWVTRGITFDSNSSTIQPESHGTLKAIAKVLRDNPDISVQIVGHTDGDGPEDYNQTLSEERAEAVKTKLSDHFGIDGSRLTTKGMGEAEPVSANDTPEGKANNRRVEFVKQ
ncbi:MAG: OmpA family protein, partial [Bacteroidota bacterium]